MYLLFDIGGTKMRITTSFDGVTFEEPQVYSTPQIFDDSMQIFDEYYSKIKEKGPLAKVVGGLPGVLDKKKEYLVSAPNLLGWRGKPIKTELETRLHAPVILENDASLVGLGEATKGTGSGFKIVAYITVSTGLGGVRIVEGRLDESIYGFEPGHQYIDMSGTVTGKLVDLEVLVSGSGILFRYGKTASEITDPKVWEEASRYLAFGLHNTIVHWSPDIIVLGGGLILNGFIDIEKVKKELKEILKIYPEIPEIRKASLGDYGGLHGGLSYLKLTSQVL